MGGGAFLNRKERVLSTFQCFSRRHLALDDGRRMTTAVAVAMCIAEGEPWRLGYVPNSHVMNLPSSAAVAMATAVVTYEE